MVESSKIILRHIGHLRRLFLPLSLDFIFSYLPVYYVVSSSSFYIIRQYLSDTCLIFFNMYLISNQVIVFLWEQSVHDWLSALVGL